MSIFHNFITLLQEHYSQDMMIDWTKITVYSVLGGVFIAWCFVVSELFNSNLPTWLSLLVSVAGFVGWIMIYKVYSKQLEKDVDEDDY